MYSEIRRLLSSCGGVTQRDFGSRCPTTMRGPESLRRVETEHAERSARMSASRPGTSNVHTSTSNSFVCIRVYSFVRSIRSFVQFVQFVCGSLFAVFGSWRRRRLLKTNKTEVTKSRGVSVLAMGWFRSTCTTSPPSRSSSFGVLGSPSHLPRVSLVRAFVANLLYDALD